jgi:hypothetical protein
MTQLAPVHPSAVRNGRGGSSGRAHDALRFGIPPVGDVVREQVVQRRIGVLQAGVREYQLASLASDIVQGFEIFEVPVKAEGLEFAPKRENRMILPFTVGTTYRLVLEAVHVFGFPTGSLTVPTFSPAVTSARLSAAVSPNSRRLLLLSQTGEVRKGENSLTDRV